MIGHRAIPKLVWSNICHCDLVTEAAVVPPPPHLSTLACFVWKVSSSTTRQFQTAFYGCYHHFFETWPPPISGILSQEFWIFWNVYFKIFHSLTFWESESRYTSPIWNHFLSIILMIWNCIWSKCNSYKLFVINLRSFVFFHIRRHT